MPVPQCDRGEDGCDRLQWAVGSTNNIHGSPSPQFLSSTHKRRQLQVEPPYRARGGGIPDGELMSFSAIPTTHARRRQRTLSAQTSFSSQPIRRQPTSSGHAHRHKHQRTLTAQTSPPPQLIRSHASYPTSPSHSHRYRRQRTLSAQASSLSQSIRNHPSHPTSPSHSHRYKRQRTHSTQASSSSHPTAGSEAAVVHSAGRYDIKNQRIWPFDFYATEMDLGFKRCCEESNRQRPVEQVFSKHFGAKFVKSTFYDHRRHWMSVASSVRGHYIDYGHTEQGRWATFLRKEIKGEGGSR